LTRLRHLRLESPRFFGSRPRRYAAATVSAVSSRPGKTSGWHHKDARGMSVSLALVMALSVSRFGQGLAREAGTEKSGVLGVNLSRASNHHARVFVGAQDEQSGTISAFPVGSARYAVNARIARALCPHNTPQPRIDRAVDKRRAWHPLPLPRSAGKGASRARLALASRRMHICSWPTKRPTQFVFLSPSGSPALRRPSTMRAYWALKVGSSVQ
jgi:hypothetical protein